MRVLVVGDAMTDVYWHGKASRLSPEAPVPIVAVAGTEVRAGGAANVAANIESLGVQVERIYGGGQRIQKIRILSGSQQVARADFDFPQAPIVPDAAFTEAVARCSLVVAVDYGKGALSGVQALIQAAGNIPVLVDPKGHDFERYRGAALIKPNRAEMRELVGGWDDQAQLDFKARQFLLQSSIGAILLTQSEDGMTLYTREATLHEPATNRVPVDVSGAGEATLAAYAAALAKGYELAACLRFASRAAGIAIAGAGTVVCKQEDVFNGTA